MKYIYQIGRLENNINDPVKFSFYNGEQIESFLSSFALKRFFNNEPKIKLLYTVSLPLNKKLFTAEKLIGEFREKINQAINNPEEYIKNPRNIFELHPHSSISDSYLLIHSFGEFLGFPLQASLDDIVIEIFIDIYETYKSEKFSELYVDISTGLNPYTAALLEAVRNFSVCIQLENFGKENPVKIFLVYTDPIIGTSSPFHRIYFDYQLKYKAFFASSISYDDIQNNPIAKRIFGEDREKKKLLNQLLENFALLFSSIKNTIPLGILTFDFDSQENINDGIKLLLKYAKEKLQNNWQVSPNLNKDDYLKCFFSLCLYDGLIKLIEELEIKNQSEKYITNLDTVKEKFVLLFDKLNLKINSVQLGSEVSNLKDKLLNILTNEWELIKNITGYEDATFDRRNYFAHCGFEQTVTEIKYSDGIISLRYKENEIERIKTLLKQQL